MLFESDANGWRSGASGIGEAGRQGNYALENGRPQNAVVSYREPIPSDHVETRMKAPLRLILVLLILQASVAISAANDGPEIQRGHVHVARTPAQLVDGKSLEGLSDIHDVGREISWQMYVPENYDPDVPAGLLVFVSPTPKGWLPKAWRPVLDEQNLIMISADMSGNGTRTKKRLLHAALAPYVAAERYSIDPQRIYVSGFSGGGKVASIAAVQFANLFTGAIYICGVVAWPDVSADQLALAKSRRYVFITGSDDFNRKLTRRLYAKYEKSGMNHISLLTIHGMAHNVPGEKHFREAIHYLDADEQAEENIAVSDSP